jgi:hypothetical protein
MSGVLNGVSSSFSVASDQLNFLYAIGGGRWKIDTSTFQMVFYKADNSTVVAKFNLFDNLLVATTSSVYERVRA